MMLSYWIICGCVSALIVPSLVAPVPAEDTERNLIALCTNSTVELAHISKAVDIVNLSASWSPENCADVTKSALLDLKAIITMGLDNVCSMNKVHQIRRFYLKYVADGGAVARPLRIPIGLSNFFLGFGLKVSQVCKASLFDQLLDEAPKIIPEEDMEAIGEYIAKDTRINRLVIGQSKYKDLIFACELGRVVIEDEVQPRRQKVFMQSAMNDHLRRIQNLCNRSFRPIYDPLVTPLVGLSTIGFNLRKRKVEREVKDERQLRKWFKIVFLCETLSNIVFVDFAEEDRKTNADKNLLNVITEAQARELMGPEWDPLTPPVSFEPVKFHPREVNLVDDLVLQPSDRQLLKAIDALAERKKCSKFYKKMAKALKDGILSHGIKFYHAKLRDWVGRRTSGESATNNKWEISVLRQRVLAHLDGILQRGDDGELELEPPVTDLASASTKVMVGVGLATLGMVAIVSFIMFLLFVVLPLLASTGAGAGVALASAGAGLASSGATMAAVGHGLAFMSAGIASMGPAMLAG